MRPPGARAFRSFPILPEHPRGPCRSAAVCRSIDVPACPPPEPRLVATAVAVRAVPGPCADLVLLSGYPGRSGSGRSEEHTSELQSREKLVCRLLLEKK